MYLSHCCYAIQALEDAAKLKISRTVTMHITPVYLCRLPDRMAEHGGVDSLVGSMKTRRQQGCGTDRGHERGPDLDGLGDCSRCNTGRATDWRELGLERRPSLDRESRAHGLRL